MGEWSEKPLRESEILTSIAENVLGVREAKFEVNGDEYNRKVSFEGKSGRNGEETKGQFFLHSSLSTCPICTKKLGNYHEAILQLRGERGERLDSVLSSLTDWIEDAPSKEIFLTKMDRRREGYDLFLSNKQFARAIARKAIELYGGTFKETSHLVGMKKGSEIYRITVSIRIPGFQKSDVIGIDKNLYLVLSIKADVITLLSFSTRSREKRRLQDLENYTVFRTGENIREVDVVYRQGATAYILDPFDFKERAVLDNDGGNKVRVIKVGDEIFVVPQA